MTVFSGVKYLEHLATLLRGGGGLRDRAFYDATVRPLASHLHKLGLRNPQDLEEVIQETYLEAYKSLASLQDAQAALAWLLTIGRRQLGRHLERKKRDVETAEVDTTVLPSPAAPVDGALDARRLVAEVRAVHARLACPKRKLAIDLYYFQEVPLPEIVERLGVGASTVTTWLSRFRQEVRAALGEQAAHRFESPSPARSS